MLTLQRAGAIRREMAAARHIPYSAHVAQKVVRTVFGDYVQVFRLGGASFESADDAYLNTLNERLNVLWRNIASPNVALWAQVIRRRECCGLCGELATGFASQLATRYRDRLARETLMVNELFLALLYRPVANATTGVVARLLSRAQPEAARLELTDALDACAKLGQTLLASLAHYDPELLGVYRDRDTW